MTDRRCAHCGVERPVMLALEHDTSTVIRGAIDPSTRRRDEWFFCARCYFEERPRPRR